MNARGRNASNSTLPNLYEGRKWFVRTHNKNVTTLGDMPRSEEAASWYTMVYRAVREIPYGRVTSYGHIALLLGYREYKYYMPHVPTAWLLNEYM